MIDFFMNYPGLHYLKSAALPSSPSKIGMYLSRDHTQMLVKNGNFATYWNGAMRETQGCPTLEIFTDESPNTRTPTSYRREIYKPQKLYQNNPLHVVIDHPEVYLSTYTVNTYDNAGDLLNALKTEPATVISNWKNLGNTGDYVWEILSTDLKNLRGPDSLPKKVILCGFPEEKAVVAANWAKANKQELCNIVPTTIQLLRWIPTFEGAPNFFFLGENMNEIVIAQYEAKEIKNVLLLRTPDGFTSEEINDLNEMTEEGDGKASVLICWGILPGSPIHERIKNRYPNLKTLTADFLRGQQPIDPVDDKVAKIQSEHAWLLNDLCK